MRRRWMSAVAVTVAGVLSLSACGGGGDASGTDGGQTAKKQVEVFSWWTGPGEADGLKAMREIFEKQNPNLTFFDAAVAGGSGDKARALLSSKLQANQPPDTFQGHAGAELQGYIKGGKLEPLNSLYDELKLKDVFPQQLVDQITYEGNVYSVPVNIHRSNVLWFNPKVLKAAGIAGAPKTIEEFITDLQAVKKAGKIPLSIGSEWTAVHLLESVLLGSLGTDAYNALWVKGADWSGPAVTKALNDFGTIMSFTGAPQDDWQPAAKQVADGAAAFNIMGDWAYGYFHNPRTAASARRPRRTSTGRRRRAPTALSCGCPTASPSRRAPRTRTALSRGSRSPRARRARTPSTPRRAPSRLARTPTSPSTRTTWSGTSASGRTTSWPTDPARRGRQRRLEDGHHRGGRPVPAEQGPGQAAGGAGRGRQGQQSVS